MRIVMTPTGYERREYSHPDSRQLDHVAGKTESIKREYLSTVKPNGRTKAVCSLLDQARTLMIEDARSRERKLI